MAYEETLRNVSLDADSSLAGYTGISGQPGAADPHYGKAHFRFVKVTGDDLVGRAAAAGDPVIGVCQNKPQVNNQAATVAISGITMMLAGAAVVATDACTSDAQGRAVKAGAGEAYHGIAVRGAAAAGHLFPMLIISGSIPAEV